MATLFFDIETRALSKDEDAALSPATATLGALTIYDLERAQGVVYLNQATSNTVILDEFWQVKMMPEAAILREFWNGTESYDTYVGFGIRRFDIPFLTHRSIAQAISVHDRFTNKRYLSEQSLPFQVDLQDEFSFYGSMSKPLSLQQLFELYQVKDTDQVQFGEAIAALFLNEQQADLITHCVQKLVGTAQLYDTWCEYLAPTDFLNTSTVI